MKIRGALRLACWLAGLLAGVEKASQSERSQLGNGALPFFCGEEERREREGLMLDDENSATSVSSRASAFALFWGEFLDPVRW